MKWLISTTIFLIVINNASEAQNILSNKFNTLENYLKNSLKNVAIDDTCFVGFYNISFSLTKEKKLIDFDYSKGLPINTANKLKSFLIAIGSEWDTDFVNNSLNKTIIQPLFLDFQNNCILQKMQINSKDTTEVEKNLNQENIIMQSLISLAINIASIKKTFSVSNNYFFWGDKNARICILLNSALITSERKIKKPAIRM